MTLAAGSALDAAHVYRVSRRRDFKTYEDQSRS